MTTPLTRTVLILTTAFMFAAGCNTASTVDPGKDAAADAAPDTETDTGTDSATDATTDAITDSTTDAATDSTTDAATDSAIDVGTDAAVDTITAPPTDPDVNEDGTLHILIIGTNVSIQQGGEAFSPDQIAAELQNILSADPSVSVSVNVVAEDIHRTQQIVTGYGQGGDEYTWTYMCHSLAQYYYWPEGRDARMENLAGNGDVDWDQVVIAGDPHIVAGMPGYYSLGVNKVAAKVDEGNAQPLLLMLWPRNENVASIDHFEQFTYRTSDGAKVELPVVPAGRAWADLPANKKDSARIHPTPNGAYLAAAAIYAHM
jgi:hypothetical protein